MAAVIPLPARAAETKGLLYWMERVLRERERVLAAPEEEAVHDLRRGRHSEAGESRK